jgi:hypothetical protein
MAPRVFPEFKARIVVRWRPIPRRRCARWTSRRILRRASRGILRGTGWTTAKLVTAPRSRGQGRRLGTAQLPRDQRQTQRCGLQWQSVDEKREPDELSDNESPNHQQKRAREYGETEAVAQQSHSRTTFGSSM